MIPDALQTIEAPAAFSLLSLQDRPWAMTRDGLAWLVEACAQMDLDAVAARAGVPVEGAPGVTNYSGTAVVNIRGPIMRYRSFWSWLLGGSSVEATEQALTAALEDGGVQRIVLAINSPGGQVDGIHALANKIRAAHKVKPVTAFVEGMGASAAYWLASAAGKIIADETAQLGSIGVLATVIDTRKAEEKQGVKRYEIVSSQSPLKRTDPATDEGREQIQNMVDALAAVFIQRVAKFRGFDALKVERDFGQGAVMQAAAAVTVGMADALGSLEDALSAGSGTYRISGIRAATAAMDEDNCDCPEGTDPDDCECDDVEESASAAPEGEGNLITPTEDRQRIAAILTCEEARGREELARALALETNFTVDAAKALLLKAVVAATAPVNALDARMSQIPNPQVGVNPDSDNDSAAAEVARILAYVPKHRKHPAVQ